MTKPVDLIVANVMHEASDALPAAEAIRRRFDDMIRAAPGGVAQSMPPLPDTNDEIARGLACRLAHQASLSVVYGMLAAAGAPASAEMIREGLQAVKDMAERRP